MLSNSALAFEGEPTNDSQAGQGHAPPPPLTAIQPEGSPLAQGQQQRPWQTSQGHAATLGVESANPVMSAFITSATSSPPVSHTGSPRLGAASTAAPLQSHGTAVMVTANIQTAPAEEAQQLLRHHNDHPAPTALSSAPASSSRRKSNTTRPLTSAAGQDTEGKADEEEAAEDVLELSEGSRWGYGQNGSCSSGGRSTSPRRQPASPSQERGVALFSPQEGREGPTEPHDRAAGSTQSNGKTDGRMEREEDEEDAMKELLRRLAAVKEWADTYRRTVAPSDVPFQHVLGVVNPLSGENNAAALVERGMLSELGRERVVVLNGTVFANSSLLRSKMKEQAFVFHDPPTQLLRELTAELKGVQEMSRVPQGAGAAVPFGERATGKYTDVDSPMLADAKPGKAIVKEQRRQAKLQKKRASLGDVFRGDAFTQERGTVVISGGDGTVSFIMDQVHLARREMEAELMQLLKPTVPLTLPRSHPGRTHALRIAVDERAAEDGDDADDSAAQRRQRAARVNGRFAPLLDVTRYFTMPAVAPIPMGTGNDYSNCVGFGAGFTAYRGSGLCCCCESDVSRLLHELVDAPSIPFDRWTADFVPLRVAQENLKPVPSSPGQDSVNPTLRPLEPNMANTVHHVDWKRIHASPGCASVTITNYLGIGFDAYVTTQFAKARKDYPALCSSRVQNKAVYGVFGIRGGVTCRTIRNLIPMVCVPSAWSGATASTATALSRGKPDMVALQLPSSCKALVMTNVSRYSSGKQPWRPMEGELYYRPVELSYREAVPSDRLAGDVRGADALRPSASAPTFPAGVSPTASVTSPNGASGVIAAAASSFPADTEGAQRTQDHNMRHVPSDSYRSFASPRLQSADMAASFPATRVTSGGGVAEDRIVPARAAVHRPPIITPVAINDRRFELQAMGGVLSYATLGLGLHGATKITQTGEMFIFALCTPDDLRYERAGGLSSPFSRNQMAKYQQRLHTDVRVQSSLNVQIDGEAIPRITEPTIVHVYPMSEDRIYVRCRNAEVVRKATAEDAVGAMVQ